MKKFIYSALGLAAILAVAGFEFARSPEKPVNVTVDPSARYQTIHGWEVVLRVWEYNKAENRFDDSWYEMSDMIFDMLVNEVGINRVRLEIRTGSENPVDYWSSFEAGEISYTEMKSHFYHKVNDNSDPSVADPAGFQFSFLDFQVERILKPIKDRVEANGERLFINLNVVDFNTAEDISDLSLAREPEEYGELIAAAFRHLEDKYDIRPDALEIILEPENTAGWTGEEIGAAASAAIRRLGSSGNVPEIIIPSTVDARNAVPYFEQAIKWPGVREHVGAISYHRYWGAGESVLREIRATAEEYGVRAEMLEYIEGTEDELIKDLTITDASAWQVFSIAAKREPDETSRARSVLLYGRPKLGTVELSHQGRVLAPVFRAVRTGAVRIGAVSDDERFETVAFENLNGGLVVVVRSGAGDEAEIVLSGVAEGAYSLTIADAETVKAVPTTLTADATGKIAFAMLGGKIAVLSAAVE